MAAVLIQIAKLLQLRLWVFGGRNESGRFIHRAGHYHNSVAFSYLFVAGFSFFIVVRQQREQTRFAPFHQPRRKWRRQTILPQRTHLPPRSGSIRAEQIAQVNGTIGGINSSCSAAVEGCTMMF
jgi:hypothetical protein